MFKNQSAVALDSLSAMVTTCIKDEALRIPRSQGNSPKRQKGIPELDDYGVMGELTRQILSKLLNQDKHIVVTALLKIDKPDPEKGQGGILIGPALPGQMFLGAPAMFDIVMVGQARDVVEKNAEGKPERKIKRFWLTQNDGVYLAKSRIKGINLKDVLLPLEPYDVHTGEGTFPHIFSKVQKAYAEIYNARNLTPPAPDAG